MIYTLFTGQDSAHTSKDGIFMHYIFYDFEMCILCVVHPYFSLYSAGVQPAYFLNVV